MRRKFISKSLTFTFYIAFLLFSSTDSILALNYINDLHNEDKGLIVKKSGGKKSSGKKSSGKKSSGKKSSGKKNSFKKNSFKKGYSKKVNSKNNNLKSKFQKDSKKK